MSAATETHPTDGVEMAKNDSHADNMKQHGSAKVKGQRRTKPFIILIASCAALGGLIFGYDIGGAGATFVMPGKFVVERQKVQPS
jgi:ABC-type methionine transport system permease subunit